MSSAMTRLFRLPGLAQFISRRGLASRASKASQQSSPLDAVIGLSVFMVCVMGPSGWILAHLENYKKRD